jgi:hypothetical protein
MKGFIFLLVLITCVISFPHGWDRKEDNIEWHVRKSTVLVKMAYPYIEAGLTKVFDSGKRMGDAAAEEIEKFQERLYER